MQIIIVWNKHWLKNTVNNSYLKGRYLKVVYWLERVDAGYLTILETEQQFPDHKYTKTQKYILVETQLQFLDQFDQDQDNN